MSSPHTAESLKEVVRIAEQTNNLLIALLSHPQMNMSNPQSAPKPLFFAADFVRRTYTDNIVPMMPRDAPFKSTRFANKYVVRYSNEQPEPTGPNDEYLNDPANWPPNSPAFRENFTDTIGRGQMIASLLTDPVRGQLLMQGSFDWKNPVDIDSLARELMKP